MTDLDLMEIFKPTVVVEHDPYNGFGREEYERREAEKKAMRQRQRAIKALAQDHSTPNRATWHCSQCYRGFERGESFYLRYDSNTIYATIKCRACYEALPTDRAPIVQATLVREVL